MYFFIFTFLIVPCEEWLRSVQQALIEECRAVITMF